MVSTIPHLVSEEIRRADNGFGEQHVLNDNGGLSSFHHFEEEEEGGSKAKLIGGALVVALLLGAAGLYAYTGSRPATMASKAPASSVASNTPRSDPDRADRGAGCRPRMRRPARRPSRLMMPLRLPGSRRHRQRDTGREGRQAGQICPRACHEGRRRAEHGRGRTDRAAEQGQFGGRSRHQEWFGGRASCRRRPASDTAQRHAAAHPAGSSGFVGGQQWPACCA